jgi:hypothetical protein
MHEYSVEDLLLYLYKEASPTTTAAIEEALQKDWALREKLAVLKASKIRLSNLIESPRTEAVLTVLNYASEEKAARTV